MTSWDALVRATRRNRMKRRFFSTATALTVIAVLGVAFAGAAGAKTNRVLAFDVMTPVVGPYVGSTNPIRGINGGGGALSLGRSVPARAG